jgi:broad specificity phosphatase PhoE
MAFGSIAIRISSRFQFEAFSAPNHRKPFPTAQSAGQAIAMRNRTIWKAPKVLAVLAATVIVGACSGTTQARNITLTFVRNAQSQADADGVIDTDVPGASLTDEGKGQARQLVHQISRSDIDSIYASPMAEARQTAEPLASELGKRAEIIDGLQSISAGWYNGKPQSMANSTYMVAVTHWLNGDFKNSVPGSISGTDFNNQFTAAVWKIYDSRHSKPVVFSQGTAIMVWTLLNVKNPKSSLLTSHPLPNAGRVVITGNPMDGWTLVDWDGIRNFT